MELARGNITPALAEATAITEATRTNTFSTIKQTISHAEEEGGERAGSDRKSSGSPVNEVALVGIVHHHDNSIAMALLGGYRLILLPTSLGISNGIGWIMYTVAPGCRHRRFSAAPSRSIPWPLDRNSEGSCVYALALPALKLNRGKPRKARPVVPRSVARGGRSWAAVTSTGSGLIVC